MQKTFKVLIAVLLFQTVFFPLSIHSIASAQTGSTDLSFDSNVQECVLDETKDSIYLTAPNRLYFVKASTMELMKTLTFDGTPTDLDLYNGKLYIPVNDQTLVIDSASQSKVDTLPLSASRIALDQNKIFYATKSYEGEVKVYDLNQKKDVFTFSSEKFSTSTFDNSDLTIDYQRHLLYVGEGTYLGNLFRYSTMDFKKVGKSSDDLNKPFNCDNDRIVFDGNEIFYNTRSLNAADFTQINGNYRGGNIKFVKGDNVYSCNAIYNRHLYVKVADLPVITNVVTEDSKGFTYYFDTSTNRFIKKVIPKYLPQTNYSLSNNKLTISGGITDWAINETAGMIYAISEDTNKLYWIRMNDLKIVKEAFVGSKPTDIEYFNGKLYIPLNGATKVVAVDGDTGSILDTYSLLCSPYTLQVDAKRIYYTGEVNGNSINVYDLADKTNQMVKNNFYHYPTLCLNRNKEELYIGDSRHGELYSLNTTNLSVIPRIKSEKLNDYKYSTVDSPIVLDGDNLYFSGFYLKTDQITYDGNIRFYDDDILYAHGNKIFGKNASYNPISGLRLTPKFEGVDLAYMDSKDMVYCYRKNNTSLYKSTFTNYTGGSEEIIKPISREMFFKDFPLPNSLIKFFPVDIENHWAINYLNHFIMAGILSGYKDSKGMYSIKPDNKITRAEFVTLIVHALHLYSFESGKSFLDVKTGDWYYDNIRVASALGIVYGSDDKHFSPNALIRRDEMAAIIMRAMGATLDKNGTKKNFSDISGNWAKDIILQAAKIGIISGFADGTFRPAQNATRAEAVTMLYIGMKKQNSNLPIDVGLINYAIYNDQNVPGSLNAGFEDEYEQYLYNIFDEHLGLEGYDYAHDCWGDYQVEVLEKSNSLAVLRLKGVTHQYSRNRWMNNSYMEREAYREQVDVLVYMIIENGYYHVYYTQPYQ